MAKSKTKTKTLKAKVNKTAKVKVNKTETKKASAKTFKYGIPHLAKILELKEASVRLKLRAADIPKTGKTYGWNSQSEMEEVAKKLKK